jgi:hypothetical protein
MLARRELDGFVVHGGRDSTLWPAAAMSRAG